MKIMKEVPKEERNITVCTHDGKYSNNNKCRSQLTVTWSIPVNRKAVVIGINPSKANDKRSDRTLTLTARYLNMYGFDEFLMLNIFENYATNQKDIGKKKKTDFSRFRHELEEADIIFIAWGVSKNIYRDEKEQIEVVLKPYKDKLYCAKNNNGRFPVHPRRISYSFDIIKYIY